MPTIYHDFETGSPLDLTDVGAQVYSCCSETRVWCMAWAIDDGEVQITIPGKDPVPPEWIEAAANPEWRFSAFNTSFERAIAVNILGPRFGWPVPLLERYECSQTLALSYALPAALEGAAAVLKLANQKDFAGSGTMRKWAKPRKARKGEDRQQLYWQDDPHEFEQLCAYCAQDVRTERDLGQRLPPLPAGERALWLLSEQVNERGFYTDGPLINAAIRVADWFAADINRQLSEVTAGGITAVAQIPHRIDWLREHGYEGDGTDKTVVARQLRRKNLPHIIRQVLDLRQAGAHAAAAKPEAFKRWRAADGRVHGAFKFHGAHTGRWTSYGVQAQNLKRSDPKLDIESAVTAVINDPAEVLRTKYPHTLDMIGNLARAFICAPPGHTLIAADFSGIEARLTAWISGDLPELEQWAKFDRTQCTEDEPYYITGVKNFRLPKEQARDPGKTGTLAFGFMGSIPAWRRIAALALPEDTISDEEVLRRRDAWRSAHPRTTKFWGDLNRAAIRAVQKKGQTFTCGRISFVYEDVFLFMQLPSGRRIAYPFARIKTGKYGDLVVVHKVWKEKKWADYRFGQGAYGATWIENAVQSTARDLFAAAMPRLEAHGYRVVHHTHDEIVAEVAQDFGSEGEFQRLMIELPAWAAGLPMAAKVRTGARFCKTTKPGEATEDDPIEIDEEAIDALAELIDEGDDEAPADDAEIPEVHTCAQCHLDPPDGSERRSAYNDLWLHARCEDDFIRARMAEEGLAESGASEQPTAPPPPPPTQDEEPPNEPLSRGGNGRTTWADEKYGAGEQSTGGTPTAIFTYRTATGAPFMRVKRVFNAKLPRKKAYPTERWENGRWVHGWPPRPFIPYRLPELLAAPPDADVDIFEGEKNCDRGAALGLIATCNSGGASESKDPEKSKWWPELTPYFKGRKRVFVHEDNDEAGRAHASSVIRALTPIIGEVVRVSYPELPEHGDFFDWVDQLNPRTARATVLARREQARKYNTTARVTSFNTKTLRDMTFTPIKYVVPGIIVEGLTLLAGKPKGGKSWMMLHAGVAVADNGYTLGEPCDQGDVLYCALEDNQRRLKSRMTKLLGLNREWPERLTFICEMPRLAVGGLTEIKNWIAAAPHPRLIIIDTLAMVRAPKKRDESSYDSDYAAVLELRTLAGQHGIAIVVVHHLRKMDADDAFDTVSGTLGLTGAPDTILVLKRDSNGAIILHGRGRDLEPIEKALEFDTKTCTWTVLGEGSDVRMSSGRKAVLDAMNEIGAPASPFEIATIAKLKPAHVRQTLLRMVKDGLVEKCEHSTYRIVTVTPA